MNNSSQIKYIALNENEIIPIKTFNLDTMCENPSILVIGKRGSGKSWLHDNILEKYQDIPSTVISPTEQYNPFYCKIENVESIHYKYESSIIQDRLVKQKIAIKNHNEFTRNHLEPDSEIEPPDDESRNLLKSSTNEKFVPEQLHENKHMTERMRELLEAICDIGECSLTTQSLVVNDISLMKKLIYLLAEEKQKLIIKTQLKVMYETIGQLLEREDIGINQLANIRDSIDNIIDFTKKPYNNDNMLENLPSDKVSNDAKDDSLKKTTNDTTTLKHLLFLDDCLATKGAWTKDPYLMDALFNGRHRQLTYVLTMQYPLGITPELRSNFDYVFLFAEDIISNLKRIYDHYAGFFPDFNSFRQIHRQLTEDYGCMVIINRGISASFYDKIAYYKAHYPNRKNNDINLINTV